MTATSVEVSAPKSFRDAHVGIICVALDLYIERLTESAQAAVANKFYPADYFENLRGLWDSAVAARRDLFKL